MAALATRELVQARNRMERALGVFAYTKPQISAALQAIENAMTTQNIPAGAVGSTVPQYVSARIDLATDPFQFSSQQKMQLFAFWAELKFQRDK